MAESETQGEWALPDGWAWTTLGECAQVITGTTPSKKDPSNYGDYLPLVKPPQLNDDVIYDAEDKLSVKGAELARVLPPQSVLVSCIGILGKTGISGVPVAFNQQINAVVFPPGILPRYGLYYLQSAEVKRWLNSVASATTVTIVNKSKFQRTRFPLAPLPEQHRIVAEIETQFTRLDAGVAALERAQANLRRYKASVLKTACEGQLVPTEASLARAEGRDYEPADQLLSRILAERRARWEAERPGKRYKEPEPPDTEDLSELPEGWCWTSLGQLSSHITSGSRGWAKYYSESGSLFVRVGNFNRLNTRVDLENIAFVNAPDGPEANRTRLNVGDWLITITADVGMVGVVDEQVLRWGEAFINQHVGLVRPVSVEASSYVAWSLASESLQSQFGDKQYGATKKGLNLDDLRSLVIPLPPLS